MKILKCDDVQKVDLLDPNFTQLNSISLLVFWISFHHKNKQFDVFRPYKRHIFHYNPDIRLDWGSKK